MSGTELHQEVFQANKGFYRAFENLDIKLMDQVWAQEDHVQCIHPGWGRLTGWPSVRDSWVRIFNHAHSMKFAITDIQITVHKTVAWVICTENIETKITEDIQKSQVLATNIFENREGHWAMVHHQGSPAFSGREES